RVAVLLMDRLAALKETSGVPLLFVLEGSGRGTDAAHVRPVIERARALGLDVLDLSPELERLIQSKNGTSESFGTGPRTARGNRWVGERIAEKPAAMGVARGAPTR